MEDFKKLVLGKAGRKKGKWSGESSRKKVMRGIRTKRAIKRKQVKAKYKGIEPKRYK